MNSTVICTAFVKQIQPFEVGVLIIFDDLLIMSETGRGCLEGIPVIRPDVDKKITETQEEGRTSKGSNGELYASAYPDILHNSDNLLFLLLSRILLLLSSSSFPRLLLLLCFLFLLFIFLLLHLHYIFGYVAWGYVCVSGHSPIQDIRVRMFAVGVVEFMLSSGRI